MDRDARNWQARVARMRGLLGGSIMSVQRAQPLLLALVLLLAATSWGMLIWPSRTMKRMGRCPLHSQEGS